MAYDRINWENTPSRVTPINADNLNHMDAAIAGLDSGHASQANEIDDINEEIDLLSARMDTFVALEDGSTTGDAELIDGRIGFDGTIYNSIGTAIRQQAKHTQDYAVVVSDEEPESEVTKLWIDSDETPEEIQVPTHEEFSNLKQDLYLYNSEDAFSGKLNLSTSSYNGITYTWDGTNFSVTGTATNYSVHMLFDVTTIPASISEGQKIYIKFNTSDSKVRLRLNFRNASGMQLSGGEFYIANDTVITVPTGSVKWNAVLFVNINTVISETVTVNGDIRCITAKTNKELENKDNKTDETIGLTAYAYANSSQLGELVNNDGAYLAYNVQGSQAVDLKLSKTSLAKDLLLNKNSVSNSENASILPLYSNRDITTRNGITYTWKDYNHINIVGTASAESYYNLFISRTKMIPGMKPGSDVLFKMDNMPSGCAIRYYIYKNNSTSAAYFVDVKNTQFVRIPTDATGIMVRFNVANGTTISSSVDVAVEIILNSTIKHIKMLCIGNSYTNDCTAYAPFVLEGLSDVALTMGTSYYSGASINDYIDWFDNNTATLTYYKCNGLSGKWNSGVSNKTIEQIIADEDWDIITFQQASISQGTWSTFSNLNSLIDKILTYYATVHSKAVKIGWLMPQLRLSIIETTTYDSVVDCVQNVLETTPIDFVIPCGTAVQNARGTSLNSIGDSGGLTADSNGHLQAGLPSLLASYVTTLKILELCGEPYRGILQEITRPTAEWVSAKNTPGENGTSTGVTDSNCYLAQKCAIAAIKTPFEVSTIS